MRTGIIGSMLAATAVVLLLGAGVLLNENLRKQEQRFRTDLRLEVFLRDDATADEVRELKNQVMILSGYESFEYRDKSEAYAQMQGTLGTQLLPAGGFNPFPNSLIVTFVPRQATYQTFQDAETKLKQVRCVEGVRYPKAALLSQEGIYSFFSKTASLLLYLVAAALFLVIWIGMRRVAAVRREENRVLMLLGAGWKQIGLPLVGRGLVVGIVAAIAGTALLYLCWHLSLKLSLQLAFVSSNGIALIAGWTLISGVLSGLITTRRYLR